MNNIMNTIIDKIVDETESKVRNDIKHIAGKVKNDFVNAANEVVLLYYSHYTPEIYVRTNNLRDNVVNESFSIAMNDGESALIQFSSDNMNEYEDGSKDVVVKHFMNGIHGKAIIYVESPSALDMMQAFQNSYKSILDGHFKKLGYIVK